MTSTPDESAPGTAPSDPIERQDPDLDPGLAPDRGHEVRQNPPEDGPPL